MAEELVLTAPEPKALTPMEMMAQVLQTQNPKDAVEVVKELAKLQMEMQRVDAEVEFNKALAGCQSEVRLVVSDSEIAGPGGKKWATYKALDKEIRPIYLRHDFSLSFGSVPSTAPDQIIVTCHVSRGLHTRLYQLPMDASGKGAQGGGALAKPHAILAAMEYGRRCLLKSIFNIVTGDEETITNRELMEAIEKMEDAGDDAILMHYYREAYKQFEASPDAIKALVTVKNRRSKELRKNASH